MAVVSHFTSAKEWSAQTNGPLPCAVLFEDSKEAPADIMLRSAFEEVSRKHEDKARYFILDRNRLPELSEAVGWQGRPCIQVYKEGSPVGQPLMSSSGHTGDQMEATLWRYIKTSKPS